jgi:hypothetical protein
LFKRKEGRRKGREGVWKFEKQIGISICKTERRRSTDARPIIRSVDVIYPTGIIVYVSVKLPKSVSNCLFSGFHIIGWAPVW